MSAAAVQQAIKKAGGQGPLADQVGVTQQAVSLWLHQGYVPFERLHKVQELTGLKPRDLCDPRLVSLLE